MLSSVLHSWRSWKSAPGLALLAIGALGIGIGSTSAIFSVVHAVLLKPLPYSNPDRYAYVWASWRAHPAWWTSFSYPDALDFASKVRTVETFGCSTT